MFNKVTFKAEVIVYLTNKERTTEFLREEMGLAALALEHRVNSAGLLETESGKAAIRLHIGKEKDNGDNQD